MKINFNFKKIASAASSLLMIGTTVGVAMAANYPAPFVSGGNADVAFVYGAASSNSDLAAALDLSSNLGGTGSDGTGSDSVTGEAFPLFTDSTELYLNSSLNTARNLVTDTDLPTILADDQFSGNVEADYTQTIQIGGNPQIQFSEQPTSSDDPNVNIKFGTTAATAIYNSSIVFDRAVNFTHADSKGETINLFGQEWTIGADTTGTDLVLYKSSEKIALQKGGDGTGMVSSKVTVEGKEYTIELVGASDTSATIKVTDSSGKSDTREIDEDQSRKVNGIEVAVTYADESDTLGINAEVTVGSSKITLTDGSNVEVGSDAESLDGTTVDFVDTLYTGNITQIRIQTYAEDGDTDAIKAGSSYTDPIWGSFKLSFSGLNIPVDNVAEREMITFGTSGDDELDIKFTDHRDNEKQFVWLENSSSLSLAYGDQAREKIVVAENQQVNITNYVVIGNEDEGYLLKLTQVDNKTSGTGYSDDVVEFQDVFDTSKSYSATVTSEGAGTLVVGGKTYSINYADDRTGNEGMENVRINYPDSTTAGNLILYPTIETSKGAKVGLYRPLTINLTAGATTGATVYSGMPSFTVLNHGMTTNVTGLLLPDGDGYNTVTTLSFNSTTGAGNVTVGSNSALSAFQSSTITAGTITYNVTQAGFATIIVQQLYPDGGNVATPSVTIWEEEEDNTNTLAALVVKPEGAGIDADGNGISTVQSTKPLVVAGATADSYISLDSNTDLSQLMTLYGSLVTMDQSTSDQTTAVVSYPDDQVQAMVYLAEETASITNNGGGVVTSGVVSVADNEVSTVSAKNLIVVGGSCVNMVAAKLLGSSSPICGSDFTTQTTVGSGSFLIKSFESPYSTDKVALLVAGYEAADTKNAATYLRTQTVDTSEGKAYIGTSATEATLQVS